MTEIALRDQQAADVERDRLRAWELRTLGYSYPQIAEELNISLATAWRDVQWCYGNLPNDDLPSFRGMSVARAEKLVKGHMKFAAAGDDKSARIVLLAQDHIAKLYGAYAPQQVQAQVEGQVTVRYEVVVVDNSD